MPATPKQLNISPEVRAEALKKAGEARRKRADFLKAIKAKEKDPAKALDEAEGDKVLARTPVASFIKAVPGYGAAKAAKLMEKIGIHEGRRISGLGERQKEALKEALSE